jgi:hypothetical protein
MVPDRSESGATWTMTSAVGGSPLPELVYGPCGRLRYHEQNTHKVTKSQNADQLGSLAGPPLLTVYVGVVECAPASTYSSSTHKVSR